MEAWRRLLDPRLFFEIWRGLGAVFFTHFGDFFGTDFRRILESFLETFFMTFWEVDFYMKIDGFLKSGVSLRCEHHF